MNLISYSGRDFAPLVPLINALWESPALPTAWHADFPADEGVVEVLQQDKSPDQDFQLLFWMLKKPHNTSLEELTGRG